MPVVFNENEPSKPYDHRLVTTLDQYHDKHENKDCRAYKLFGIYLDKHLTLNTHVDNLMKKLTVQCTVLKWLNTIIITKDYVHCILILYTPI